MRVRTYLAGLVDQDLKHVPNRLYLTARKGGVPVLDCCGAADSEIARKDFSFSGYNFRMSRKNG
jgi:hypothetical protein